MEEEKKVGLWRYIITKRFCHHQFKEIDILERKNSDGVIVAKVILRECSICGKSKKDVLSLSNFV